ncbi:MAG: EhaG family protein [Methanocalculaceae archaeon]|jgi:energy-converting hydrogenase A subunit G|nr:EhaG family protein [Methanocalculaceae archaeon]
MIEYPLETALPSQTFGFVSFSQVSLYQIGITIAFVAIAIAFSAIVREKDDIHKMLLIDLIEITGLVVIVLIATDLAEALILPGLVVGIAEIMVISELWLAKEELQQKHSVRKLDIEVMQTAPPIIGLMLAVYGIFLTGFSGGLIAALGLMIFFLGKNMDERFAAVENAAGYAWALWVLAFLIFMFIPSQWFLAVMLAAVGILLKVMAKMSLVGTMRGLNNV